MDRVRRRLVDRILSLFMPVVRYRCWSYECKWEGLFDRLRRASSERAAS
jgi:hypothetical protein